MSGNMVKICMIRAHKIIRHWRTNDFHWKRSMASLSRRLAQNQVAAPLRREENESSYGPSGQEYYRGGPARTHPPSILLIPEKSKKLEKNKVAEKSCVSFLFRQNGPASAAPVQEGHFWKRSETKSEFFA